MPVGDSRSTDTKVKVEGSGATDSEREWTVLFLGHGNGFHLPVDADDWERAISSVVENVAAGNAEANDRIARGEFGWSRLWSLPGRPACRR